ncbi:MAG TPA: hypothetical protein VMB52_04605 [Verrucomicrobiae bacterium]|nr:hypothetical protein [Verrucomicrobiae bacterium]
MAIFIVTIGVLIAINLVPLRRGETISCGDRTKTKQRALVFGVPFPFFATTGQKTCSLDNGGASSAFNTAGLWFDLIIAGFVLVGAYTVLESRGSR